MRFFCIVSDLFLTTSFLFFFFVVCDFGFLIFSYEMGCAVCTLSDGSSIANTDNCHV